MTVERADFLEGAEGGDRAPAAPPAPLPPQVGIKGTVGSGKTKAIVQTIRGITLSDASAVAAVFVPDHALARELAGRLKQELGPGVPVGVWRGRDQPRPGRPLGSTWTMCRRAADARAVTEAGGETADLCGSKGRRFCPYHPDHPAGVGPRCAYVPQGRQTCRVWVLTHSMLSRAAPKPLRRDGPAADFVVIDEAFWKTMLGGFDAKGFAVELADLTAPEWGAVPDQAGDIPGLPTRRLTDALGRLSNVLASSAPGAAVGAGELAAAGLTAAGCRLARVYAFRCKVSLPRGLPTTPDGTANNLLGSTAQTNRMVLRVTRLLDVTARLLTGETGPGAIRIGQGRAVGQVFLRWLEPIHPDWLEASQGIIHADATMQEDMVRVWLPRLAVQPAPPVAAPHMRVAQTGDRALSYRALLEARSTAPGDKAAAGRNAARVRRVVDELGRRYAGKGAPGGPDVLAVLPDALERQFRAAGAPPLPANVGTLHFGKLRGQDGFKGVAALLVVSRPLPGPQAMEDVAEIVFGRRVGRLPPGSFYPRRVGTGATTAGVGFQLQGTPYHPDPHAEAVRWASCEAEIIQAIGRGRGVHRTATTPLDVLILTNTPLPEVPVTEDCTMDDIWDELAGENPVLAMLAAGVLPLDWPGVGAVLAGLGWFTGASDLRNAAICLFARDRGLKAALGEARAGVAKGGRTSVKRREFTYGVSTTFRGGSPWARFDYRRVGQRRAGAVLISPDHADPKAALTALVGTLQKFDRVVAAATAPSPRPSPPAPAPSAPEAAPPIAAPPAPPPQPQPSPQPPAVLDLSGVHLPRIMDALTQKGLLSRKERQQRMGSFRLMRGTPGERERAAMRRLIQDFGMPAVTAAAFAAVEAKAAGTPQSSP